MRRSVLLSFLFCCILAQGLGCDDLPELPKVFQSFLEINAKLTERGANQYVGYTLNAFQAVDETLGRALFEIYSEFNWHDYATIFREKVIWNVILDGSFQFLNIVELGQMTTCYADKLTDESIFDDIFGYDQMHAVPTVAQMLHFGPGMGYTCEENTVHLGVPVRHFKTTFQYPNIKGEFSVDYYWTDPTVWGASDGYNKSAPIGAHIGGFYHPDPQSERQVEVDMEVIFVGFEEIEPRDSLFYPPADIWCEDRVPKNKLKQLPMSFTFDSESLFHWVFTEERPFNVMTKQTEYYDYVMQVSRTDYKPFDYHHIDDPFAGNFGFVSDIKDFHSGVRYRKYKDFGNCSAEFIGFDSSGDITMNPDGSVHITPPMYYWNMDKEFAFNGIFETRGVMVESFVTFSGLDSEHEGNNYTTVIQLATENYLEEGETVLQHHVPIHIEVYETKEYNHPSRRVKHNIFGFTAYVPDFRHFDISPCFFNEEIAHRVIRLGWKEGLAIASDPRAVDVNIRRAIHLAADVTPIRVQNIEVDVKKDESAMLILFSIVDWPQSLNKSAHPHIPPQSLRPLSEALELLEKTVKSGNFEVEIPLEGSTETVKVAADPNYFETVGDRGTPDDNTVIIEKGQYSPGDMAGLAFGMIFLGLALSGCVYYFFLRSRVRAQIPTNVRGFDNPMHGTSNLAKP